MKNTKLPVPPPTDESRLLIVNAPAFEAILKVLESRINTPHRPVLDMVAQEILLALDLNHPPAPPLAAVIESASLNPQGLTQDLLMSALSGLTLGAASDERSVFVNELNRRLRAREKEGSGV